VRTRRARGELHRLVQCPASPAIWLAPRRRCCSSKAVMSAERALTAASPAQSGCGVGRFRRCQILATSPKHNSPRPGRATAGVARKGNYGIAFPLDRRNTVGQRPADPRCRSPSHAGELEAVLPCPAMRPAHEPLLGGSYRRHARSRVGRARITPGPAAEPPISRRRTTRTRARTQPTDVGATPRAQAALLSVARSVR